MRNRKQYFLLCYPCLCAVASIFVLIAVCTLSSCRSSRQLHTTTDRQTEIKTDTFIQERLVPVRTPEDSARVRALLECDKNGRVLLSWFDQQCSKNAELQFSLDSLGRLVANFHTKPDTVFVPVKDTTISNQKNTSEKERVEVEVEKKLNGLQRYLLNCGVVFNVLLLAGLVYGIFRLKKKFLS